MKKYYYNIEDDVAKYPEAWCYIVTGGRNQGKTYGALKSCLENHRKFVFLKRTIEDVKLLTAGSNGKMGDKGADFSPFKSINRDTGENILAFDIYKGYAAGFWKCNEDNEPIGDPIGYIIALSAVTKVKGFDLSDADWLIFDEFIPQPWERVDRREGEQLMDLYKTISRDREHRGREELKLLCFANEVNISNPTSNMLEITDSIVEMAAYSQEYRYIEDRYIMIHHIIPNPDFISAEKNTKIMQAMSGTRWGKMALGEGYAYDDFTSVKRVSLKGYKIRCHIIFKSDNWYLYQNNDGKFYMTKSRQKAPEDFNLNLENDQKRFFLSWVIDLRNECINDNVIFDSYTMYDVIINYKKWFSV